MLTTAPQDVDVDPEVFVDQDVPEPGDLLPLDLGTASPEICREALDGFADDLEVPHHRVDRHVVRRKRILGQTSRVSADSCDGPQDVFEVDPRVPGHGGLR